MRINLKQKFKSDLMGPSMTFNLWKICVLYIGYIYIGLIRLDSKQTKNLKGAYLKTSVTLSELIMSFEVILH